MKLSYIKSNKDIKKKTKNFEIKINKASDVTEWGNEDPIKIEFYDNFDNIPELNSDDSVDIEMIKNDIAFASSKKRKVYVKNESISISEKEYNFMLAHEVAHIYVNDTNYKIKFKYDSIHCEITINENNGYKEELADYLSWKWGFKSGLFIGRKEQGEDYLNCFVKDESEFAQKIYTYRNKKLRS